MTPSYLFRRNWRVVVVGVLGAVIAFAASFLLDATYASSTELLIRGRDATFLTSNAQDLSTQPGVVDSTLSQSLADTYAGLASSRALAVAVVDKLHLDAPKKSGSGPISALSHGLVWVYRCGRAYITSGFCAKVDDREKAILDVQQGIQAAQHGSTTGQTAGTPGSYVLDVVATGTSPEQARDITNAVADELVAMSNQRFKDDATQYVKTLTAQVAAATTDTAAKSQAITTFSEENHVSPADQAQASSVSTYQSLQNGLSQAQADLADNQAQLTSVNASLASTSATLNSTQQVNTGRSSTQLNTNAANPVYTNLQTTKSTLQATIDGLNARISQIEGQLAGPAPSTLNSVQSQLALLQQAYALATSNEATLTTELQKAQSNAASSTVELTRVDEAGLPSYPIAPKRYLYLLLGLLIGALVGGGLTWLDRRHERGNPDPDSDNDSDGATSQPSLVEKTVPLTDILSDEPVRHAYSENGNNHHETAHP